VFNEYMSVKSAASVGWCRHQQRAQELRNSYLRFLRGWGVDSNSIEAAVLKAWVESRIGFRRLSIAASCVRIIRKTR